MTLDIRKATENDCQLIASFGRETFEAAFKSDNDPDNMLIYLETSFSAERIAAELAIPETTFLLAYHQHELIGYAKLQPGAPSVDTHGEDAIQLARLYTAVNQYNKGIGSRLIEACFDEALRQGFKTIWLGVWNKNNRAQRFYERLGFIRIGSTTFILGKDVQQDVVYERSLALPAA